MNISDTSDFFPRILIVTLKTAYIILSSRSGGRVCTISARQSWLSWQAWYIGVTMIQHDTTLPTKRVEVGYETLKIPQFLRIILKTTILCRLTNTQMRMIRLIVFLLTNQEKVVLESWNSQIMGRGSNSQQKWAARRKILKSTEVIHG